MPVQPKAPAASVPTRGRRRGAGAPLAPPLTPGRRRPGASDRQHAARAPSSATADGADPGLGALFLFVAALLLMVAMVAVAGAVDRWWVLVPVMLVDLAATFAVLRVVGGLLGDDGEPL